ncbi:MAG: glycosyltransferase family 39 protein, partial [Candidatus Shapirobacteria bacterium]|nr:glycosyltransferase family 39 protein [Candidatus Shapirobacteria bacterium]
MINLKRESSFLSILFLIVTVFLVVNFWDLGKSFLYDWDEGIYAQVARESRLSPILVWNQKPWFEKPPLVFWLTSLSFSLFKETELAARFFMPILGAVSLLLTYLLIKERVSERVAIISLLFFLIPSMFWARSQGLNTDISLLVGTVGGLFFLTRLEKKLGQKIAITVWDYFWPAFLVSFSVMSKGLIGFLPALVWLVYLIFVQRSLLKANFKNWLIVALLVAAIISPWHIYLTVRFGRQFWQVYFIEHIFRRAYQPIEYHFGGKLYYIKFLILEFGYWLLPVVIGGLLWLLNQIKKKKIDQSFAFFLIWGGLVFCLFTFSKTKLFWYILPIYPALAVCWGVFWDKFFYFKKRFLIPVIFLALFLVLIQKYLIIIRSDFSIPGPKIALAITAKNYCQPPLLFLVDKNERAAKDILPDQLTLSSSFSYGGSPSVVFYFADQVNFFYQPNQFQDQLLYK